MTINTQKIVGFIFIFVTHLTWTQVPKTPKFPELENTMYDLLEEDKVNHSISLHGKVKQIEVAFKVFEEYKTYTTYRNDFFNNNGKITQTVITEYDGFEKVHNPYTQHLDSIDGFKRIILTKNPYSFEEYWYKNGQLVKKTENEESHVQNIETFVYDKKGRLTEKRTYVFQILMQHENDSPLVSKKEVITEIGTYNNDNFIKKEKYVFSFENNTIERIQLDYEYDKNGLFKRYNYESASYNADHINLQKPLESQKYLDTDKIKSKSKRRKGVLYYNENKKVSKFYVGNSVHHILEEEYDIVYEKNKMTIKGVFRQSKQECFKPLTVRHQKFEYQYTFDTSKNPIKILSYIVDKNGKKLDKETTLNITYYEN